MGGDVFRRSLRQKTGCAVIVAGSDSDGGHVERIRASLEAYDLPCEVRICSAHKSPQRLLQIIEEYEREGGAVAYVAVAGGTDALSGTLSFHTCNPVISCPPDGPNESCLRNPPGSSNATVLHPANVGRFVAQIYAPFNPGRREKLEQGRREKIRRLEEKDRELRDRRRSP
jgi:5-(carboxyamino)imidazole ribonucleotide mutase